MSALVAFVWLGSAAWIGFAPAPVEVVPVVEAQPVTATFYSCENVAANPMAPCNLTRDGSDPTTPGMACPVAWLGRVYEVPGYGLLGCDDTGRHDIIHGLPHIDIRVPTLREAINGGIQEMRIYER